MPLLVESAPTKIIQIYYQTRERLSAFQDTSNPYILIEKHLKNLMLNAELSRN